MKPEKLVSMANQIATFFRSYPADEASASIKHHLVAFWTPAMLVTLEDHIAAGAPTLDALVVRAMHHPAADTLVADTLVTRAAAPLQETGPMASDAG